MIDMDRASGGYVRVLLDGAERTVHEGQRTVRELKAALGVTGALVQHIDHTERALDDDDDLVMIVGRERFTRR